LRSYTTSGIHRISAKSKAGLPEQVLDELCASSSYTLARTETKEDRDSQLAVTLKRSLYEPVDILVGSTLEWIREEGLEGIICFNGRMDLPRGITYACERLEIPYITSERHWLGHGLQLIPNANCLSLKERERFNREYADKPLTNEQASLAGKLAAQRFLRKNELEWRLYNITATKTSWPIGGTGMKVLILPSSKNEFDGHKEWTAEWDDYTIAIDHLLGIMDLSPSRCILRCHPNWAEKIGKRDGFSSERHYTNWAARRNIFCIGSRETADTYDLINEADLIIVNGSTTGIEAALLGKRVICLGHATYQGAGLCIQVTKSTDWNALSQSKHHDHELVARRALRHLYTEACRFPQYVKFVRARTTTRYNYYEGADPERIVKIFESGSLTTDDSIYGADLRGEDEVIEKIFARKWAELVNWREKPMELRRFPVNRRAGLRSLDSIREMYSKGDK